METKSVESNDLNITITINDSFNTNYSSVHKRYQLAPVNSTTTNNISSSNQILLEFYCNTNNSVI